MSEQPTEPLPTADVIEWRLRQVEAGLNGLGEKIEKQASEEAGQREVDRKDVRNIREVQAGHSKILDTVVEGQRGVRNALLTLGGSIVVAVVAFVLTKL